MSYTPIPTFSTNFPDGTADTVIYANTNGYPDNKAAFIDRFKPYAEYASSSCYGLPVRLILGQWAGESGWGASSTQVNNQNWGNLMYVSGSNPVGNCGAGTNGWAKFYGANHFAFGYAKWFINNSRYSALVNYLKGTSSPDPYTCARYIADAGYGGADHDKYYNLLVGYINSVNL